MSDQPDFELTDTMEIAVRVRQTDGTYETRWVPLSALRSRMHTIALNTLTDVITAARDPEPSDTPSKAP